MSWHFDGEWFGNVASWNRTWVRITVRCVQHRPLLNFVKETCSYICFLQTWFHLINHCYFRGILVKLHYHHQVLIKKHITSLGLSGQSRHMCSREIRHLNLSGTLILLSLSNSEVLTSNCQRRAFRYHFLYQVYLVHWGARPA